MDYFLFSLFIYSFLTMGKTWQNSTYNMY